MVSAKKRFSLADQLRNELEIDSSPTGDVFFEEPAPLDVFIHDKKYMNQPEIILGEHQFDLIRHMEQIYLPSMYPYMVENFGPQWSPVRFVNLLNVQWGKGSGKDLSVQFAVARIAYLMLCLQNPQQYYNLAAQSDIHVLNIAMNASQAKRAFFRPLGTALRSAPWFKDKLKSDITDASTAIRLDKQVELISGHSLAANFEGLSPIAVVLDEISGFQSDDQKSSRGIVDSDRSAEAVYETVRTSASTRFSSSYKVVAISFPRYLHDPIQNFCAKGTADIEKRGIENSRYYVSGPYATWDVNPRYRTPDVQYLTIPETNVPVPEAFVPDYEDDAAVARAKYECRPERAANRYMRNDSALGEAFPKMPDEWEPPLQVFYHWGMDAEGDKAEFSYDLNDKLGWQVSYAFGAELKPMEGAVYGIHVDLAVNGDRAGISMCHIKNWERREHVRGTDTLNPDYQVDDRPIVKVDFVNYYEADLQAKTDDGIIKPREIQLRWARNLIRELRRRGFSIGLVTFDTYQSVDSIQILETWGIPADNLSMDRNIQPYANLREVIYDGRLEGYFDPILQIELESLNLLPNGKIDHPPGGSKDMADALCGAVTNAIVLGGDEGEEPEEVDINIGMGLDVSSPWSKNDAFWGNLQFGQPVSTSSGW